MTRAWSVRTFLRGTDVSTNICTDVYTDVLTDVLKMLLFFRGGVKLIRAATVCHITKLLCVSLILIVLRYYLFGPTIMFRHF